MHIAFRADASIQIGTGHVMRCLTLADALRERGAKCLFLSRRHDGHLLDLVAARGHGAIALPARSIEAVSVSDPTLPGHAHWLGTDWAVDAEDSRMTLARGLTNGYVDWLVVDHYALDYRWEQTMRPHCRRLLVVDDLADRRHDCDMLLDQNLGRRVEDYRDLLPPGTQMLIGPHYALLRPEFTALRAESLARRRQPELKHLLVTMGGVDKDNATGSVLSALAKSDLPQDLRITVVLGPHAPWLSQVRARAEAMRWPTCVLVGVSDMARLMLEADLAIGAAGSTSWERCCLGLPSIQLVLAENQRMIADALARADVATTMDISQLGHNLPELFKDSSFLGRLLARSRSASLISDGHGVERITELFEVAGQ